MAYCSNCGSQLIGTERFCPSCGQDLVRIPRMHEPDINNHGEVFSPGVTIANTHGDVIGTGVSGLGSGSIIGRNIVVGDGTINVSEQRLTQIQNNEYAESLKQFSDTINDQLKGQQIPEEKVKSINQSINELAEEVKDVKSGKEEEVDYVKQTNVEAKTASVIQKVLDVLPQAAETAATFTPLAPFSKLIGKGVQGIVDAIAKRKSHKIPLPQLHSTAWTERPVIVM